MNNIATYEAIAEVFLKNKHRLYYIAYSYVSSAYIVEEIVADTLLAVLEKSADFYKRKTMFMLHKTGCPQQSHKLSKKEIC